MWIQWVNKRRGLISGFLSALFIALLIAGCASKEGTGEDPESLYKEADEMFKDERYLMAIEKFRDLKSRYPYHSRATDAELRIADSYFEQESYLEAESAYEIFKELHPTHPRIDYVQYRIGLSYFNQIPSNAARDLTAAYHAIEAFETLAEKYPKSEFLEKSKEHLKETRLRLAEHESYVADFYFQRRHYLSATYRYSALLKSFPGLGYEEEALLRLGRSYQEIKMLENAKNAYSQLVSQYPNSPLKPEAQSLLDELNKKN